MAIGTDVTFVNESIKYQMPMLLVVVVLKYINIAVRHFKTSRNMFWWNFGGYITFLFAAILVDYKNEMVGGKN